MDAITNGEILYSKQMEQWLKEQDIIEKQIERSVEHYTEVAEINRKQLLLHRERIAIERVEYDNWNKDKERFETK